MRRVCFDIGSSYYHDGRRGYLNTPDQARSHFADTVLRFYAATAFDSSNEQFHDYTDHQELFVCLRDADEIISFNGRTCDLIVLEKLVGDEAMKGVWQKPHHDLKGWRGYSSLRSAVSNLLPDQFASFDEVERDHLSELRTSIEDEFIAEHLANTYRDVRYTFALFQLYMDSSESSCTFRGDCPGR
jgi:hypothetical protein